MPNMTVKQRTQTAVRDGTTESITNTFNYLFHGISDFPYRSMGTSSIYAEPKQVAVSRPAALRDGFQGSLHLAQNHMYSETPPLPSG